MTYYFAPMEGLTTHIFRNAHHKYFGGIDKYFTPFITTNQNMKLSSRDLNDILPEHNQNIPVVPQILSNKASEFLHAASVLEDFGYREINLNLGCPSGTVVAKGKGAGFLNRPDDLNHFLDSIYSGSNLNISIKTRLGVEESSSFDSLMNIFNQYPVSELIVHPRVQKDFYKGPLRMSEFDYAMAHSKAPVCYNGDLFDRECVIRVAGDYPHVSRLMIGRGLLMNPALISKFEDHGQLDYKVLKSFHDEILEAYQSRLSGDHNVLHKMKALWVYLIHAFPESSKQEKKIKKSTRLDAFKSIVDDLFQTQQGT